VSNTSSNVSSSREKKGLFFVQIYAAAKSEDEDEALEALNELKDILSEEVRANEVLSKGKLVGWDEPYLEEDEGVFVAYDNFILETKEFVETIEKELNEIKLKALKKHSKPKLCEIEWEICEFEK